MSTTHRSTAAPAVSHADGTTPVGRAHRRSLRALYLVRAVLALVWVGVVFATSAQATEPTALLTVLLVLYPLLDAGAVLWQLRANPDTSRSRTPERANVVVSIVVAVLLGVVSQISLAGVLVVWGAWAIGAGVPQLLTALRNRHHGGQVPQILSGGLSVIAGSTFLFQGIQGSGMIGGAAGYAALGAIFFLISALRLSAPQKGRQA